MVYAIHPHKFADPMRIRTSSFNDDLEKILGREIILLLLWHVKVLCINLQRVSYSLLQVGLFRCLKCCFVSFIMFFSYWDNDFKCCTFVYLAMNDYSSAEI